ncbi:MAG TPA: PepSY domain-containing protein [Acidisarcina sp.]|nr:PepSY domain-containing protein [Acidisarcina sp.]
MKNLQIGSILLLCLATAVSAATHPKPKISRTDAQGIALKQVSGNVKSGELEKEHGRWIYSFDIQNQTGVHEVNVDANTGVVVENSIESAADEAREKKADAAAVPPKKQVK